QQIRLTITMIFAIIALTGKSTKLWAFPATSKANDLPLELNFKPPNNGAPGNREDDGSRPGCPNVEKPFLALIPVTNWGETVSEYPTFWLYIPYGFGSVDLVLEDENTQEKIYQTKFNITDRPGIASFGLPLDAPPLDLGRKYRWQFLFFCSDNQSYDLSVDGIVKRVEKTSELISQLATAKTLREQIIVYAENGLWYETLTELAKLRRANPQDAQIAADWAALFEHRFVRYEGYDIISEPIVQCCSL
ncbi:DUF928 domain-containing protein, partial [Moorena sp. SIO3I8]|uniref:DUF928 domain-containing protein n=2 Tax=unclassified Moorena TaxID=2683338 RepID=UPI0025E4A27D